MRRDLIPVARALKHNLSSEAWESVPDPRADRGQRYTLGTLLKVLLLGLVANQETLRDVEQLIQYMPTRKALGIQGTPSDTTLYKLVGRLDPASLRAVAQAEVKAMERSKQLERVVDFPLSLVAVDGKVLGTDDEKLHPESHRQKTENGQVYHLKALRAVHVSSAARPILDQQTIPAGKGERHALVPFLLGLRSTFWGLAQCFSFDAGFWSQDLAMELSTRFTSFIFALKGNAGAPHRFALSALGSGDQDPPGGWEIEAREAHGKRCSVTRELARVEGDLGTFGAVHAAWRQRTRWWVNGELTRQDDRYFATNLPLSRVEPAQALAAIRAHWAIENDSNWTMDAILKEDTRAWAAQGLARETLSWLRIIAYNLLRVLRHRTLRASSRQPIPWRQLIAQIRDTLMNPEVLAAGFS